MNKEHVIREVQRGLDAQFEMFTWEKMIDCCHLPQAEKDWAKKHLAYGLVVRVESEMSHQKEDNVMEEAKLNKLVYMVAVVLAEFGEAPEGIIYAGLMKANASLDDFERIKAMLVELGLASLEPGPILKGTPKLFSIRDTVAASEGNGHGSSTR